MKLLQSTNSPVKKILWAVDAFHESPKDQLQAGKTLPLLYKDNPIVIQPVSVILPGHYDADQLVFLNKWSDLARAAQRRLDALFKGSKIPSLEKPRLIRQKRRSVTSAVDALISFATEEKSDVIVVSSHSRKGVERLFMGSFAETLVLRSPIPVLVLNPKTRATRKLKEIIFPTDFSEGSRKAYDRVLSLAEDLGCNILLMHKMQFYLPDLGYPFVVPPVAEDSLEKLSKTYAEAGERWARDARKRGIKASFFLDKRPGRALEEILKTAKRKGSSAMIAMASQSRPVKTALIGSLARQVLRSASCPVLIIHPLQETLTTKAVVKLTKVAADYTAKPLIS